MVLAVFNLHHAINLHYGFVLNVMKYKQHNLNVSVFYGHYLYFVRFLFFYQSLSFSLLKVMQDLLCVNYMREQLYVENQTMHVFDALCSNFLCGCSLVGQIYSISKKNKTVKEHWAVWQILQLLTHFRLVHARFITDSKHPRAAWVV